MALAPVTCGNPPWSKDRQRGVQELIAALLDAMNTKAATSNDNLATVNANLVSFQAASHTDTTALVQYLDGLEALSGTGNTNTSQLHTDLLAVQGFLDGLEGLAANTNTALGSAGTLHADFTSLSAKMDTLLAYNDGIETLLSTLTMSEDTAINSATYNGTIGIVGNPTVKASAGKVWAYSCTGIVEIRDNTTVKWRTVGNSTYTFAVPLICNTSIKLYSALGSITDVQYT